MPEVSEKSKGIFSKLASLVKGPAKDSIGEKSSSTEMLSGIYKMILQREEFRKQEYNDNLKQLKTEEKQEEKRHREILKALSFKRPPKKPIIKQKPVSPAAPKPKRAPPSAPPAKPPAAPPTPPTTPPTAPKPPAAPPAPPKPTAPPAPPPKPPAPPKPTAPPAAPPAPPPKPAAPPAAPKPPAEPPAPPKPAAPKPTAEPAPPPKPTAEPVTPAAPKPAPSKVPKTGAGKEGPLKGLDALQRQSAIKGQLSSLGASSALSSAIMFVASKETQAGQVLTESGPEAYKRTFKNLEAGKMSIPKHKYEQLIKTNPEAPQTGPGSGPAYFNFTFGKKWSAKQWNALADDPDSSGFFAAVGYLGGAKYLGRSLVGITHENNYLMIGRLLGLDLLNNPELINKDVATTSAATLAYFALTASGGIFNTNLQGEKLKESYRKGLAILESYKDPEDLKKVLLLLAAGKGNVDVTKPEQVRAAFGANTDRGAYLRTQLSSAQQAYGALGLGADDIISKSSENADMKRSLQEQSASPQNVTNNITTPGTQPESKPNKVDDRSAFDRVTKGN